MSGGEGMVWVKGGLDGWLVGMNEGNGRGTAQLYTFER